MDRTGPDPDDPGATGFRWFRSRWRDHHDLIRQSFVLLTAIAVLGGVLFAATGVWPPMVAVKSPSMEPHLSRGDLVVMMDPQRVTLDGEIRDTGVVTQRRGSETGVRSLGAPGDVIVFRPNGATGTPVIHRAVFWVNESENWYAKADPEAVDGQDCRSVSRCPAPHGGFVTKGDANRRYDQVNGISSPVRPGWMVGKAIVRIPALGHVRLLANDFGNNPLIITVEIQPPTEGIREKAVIKQFSFRFRWMVSDRSTTIIKSNNLGPSLINASANYCP